MAWRAWVWATVGGSLGLGYLAGGASGLPESARARPGYQANPSEYPVAGMHVELGWASWEGPFGGGRAGWDPLCGAGGAWGAEVEPESWMKQYRDLTLRELTLPGTHDSGAYELFHGIMPGSLPRWVEGAASVAEALEVPVWDVITPWALSQSCDVRGQLEAGARYVDLRSGWANETWLVHHTEVGRPVAHVLEQIAEFLASYPTEVVVVEVSHFLGKPAAGDVQNLAVLCVQKLGKWMYPNDPGDFSETLGEMVDKGWRAVVTFEGFEQLDPAWGGLLPPDRLVNSYANSDSLDEMVAFNKEELERFNSPDFPEGRLSKLSWTLTPQSRTIWHSTIPGRPRSLKALAREANEDGAGELNRLAEAAVDAGGLLGNLLLVDDWNAPDPAAAPRALQAALRVNSARLARLGPGAAPGGKA